MKDFLLPMLDREPTIARVVKYLREVTTKRAHRIDIKQESDDRTAQQCRYLNGVPYKLLGSHFGYERDEISEQMCGLYWGWRQKKVPRTPNNPRGIRDVPLRTTTTDESGERDVLSMKDFWEYVEFLQRFGASYDVHIPDPDPSYKHLQRDQEQQEHAA
jgi:hypothetical protein